MQISPNIYFKVELVDAEKPLIQPFITQDNMGFFQMVEPSGASLPFLVFSFFTTDQNIIGYFSPNNKVQVTVGTSAEDSAKFIFRPLNNPKKSETSERGWEVVVGGFIGDGYYMTAKNNELYVGTSIAVLDEVMQVNPFEYLEKEVQTNILEINEEPTRWIRANETLCSFVMDTVLHMDIRPSFPLVCIDKFGQMHVNDCMKALKEPKWTFVPDKPQKGEILYYNNFNVDSHRPLYDFYSGYSKVTQIQKVSSGNIKYEISDNKPVIASTKLTETFKIGPRNKTNKLQSDNVHDTYHEVFQYNTDKLVSMSAVLGSVRLVGFYRDLKATDVVNIKLPKDDTGELSDLEGFYVIDSIQTTFDFRPNKPRIINTNVFVTRDNPNNVENYVPKKGKNLMKIGKEAIQDLCDIATECRVALAVGSRFIDGTFIKYCTNFLIETKNNLLRMFAVGGVTIDFNSQALFLQSALCTVNMIMNSFMNMIFPDFIATTLNNFLIDQPSNRRLLSKYIDQYVPSELQDIISALTDSFLKTHDSLNSIAKANNITARSIPEVPTETVPDTYEEPIDIVGEIIKEFEVHTRGVDLPFPVVTLTESEQLLSRAEIKDYIADRTIENLNELGYMDNVDEEEFKAVLVSNDPEEMLSFATIDQINRNAGNLFMYRYWGTYGPTNETLYAWSYENNTIYTKTDTISENTRLYNSNYTAYTTKEPLYAWVYEGKVIYTETLDIQDNTKLLNKNYSVYTGEDFTVELKDDSYVIVYKVDEEHYEETERDISEDLKPDFDVEKVGDSYEVTYKGKVTTRNEYEDVNTTALAQLTPYYITKGFKDKYRTLPCTKVINAVKNSRLYFVCPQVERNIKFYINSKRVELESFPIDLGYVDTYGNKILYNVYYTTTGYNSNNTTLEVRQG